MNKWLKALKHQNPQAEPLLRRIAITTALLGVPVWLAYVFWRLPVMRAEPDYYHQYIPTALTILPAVVFFSLGLATLICLFTQNRRRLRTVLRPTKGRIIGALILGFLTPLVVFNWTPWIVIGIAVLMSGTDSWGLPLALLPGVAWYLPSCLIVSGVKSRPLRVAIYSLFWWASFSAHFLFNGVLNFRV